MITSKTLRTALGWLLIAPLGAVAAQPVRLVEALREADTRAFANRQARAATEAEAARARLPLKGMLPAARLEAGFVRTTDPIGAFGTTLRQRAVSPAAFDPARLNDPAPVNNLMGGVVLELPVLNTDAIAGWTAARRAAEASSSMTDWTVIGTRAAVVRAWFGTALAADRVRMLEEAHRTALAGVRQVESMVRQGLVTKADVLQASVRADDVAAQLLDARHGVATAGQQLALLLGRTGGDGLALTTGLPDADALRRLAAEDTVTLAGSDRRRRRPCRRAARRRLAPAPRERVRTL
jgi:outer membrane protein TolC